MDHQRHKRAPAIIIRGSGAGGWWSGLPRAPTLPVGRPSLPYAPVAGLRSGRLSSGWLLEAIVLGPGETRRWSSRTTGRPSCGRPRERGGH